MTRATNTYAPYELDSATVGGNSLSSYIQSLNSSSSISGTSSVTPLSTGGTLASNASPLNQILGRTLYVDDFGAAGNAVTNGTGGGTDDGPAFQAAINALGARGGIIRLAPKSYRIATPINITAAPVHFIGDAQFESASAQSGTVISIDTLYVSGTNTVAQTTADSPAGQNVLNIPTAGLSLGQTILVGTLSGQTVVYGATGSVPMVTSIVGIGSASVTLSRPITTDIPSGTTITVYTSMVPFTVGQAYTSNASFNPSGAAIGTHFDNITFYQIQPAAAAAPTYTSTLSTAAAVGATSLSVSSTTNLAVGQTFTGPQAAVPLAGGAPITITAISGTTLTLSSGINAAMAANATLSFTLLTPWAPTPYDYVIKFLNLYGGFQLTNIFFLGCTNGVYSTTCGHFRYNSVDGQCFVNMIRTENCLDSPYFDYIRSWDYETGNLNQRVYQQVNQNVLEFGRCDGFEVQRLFCFSAHSLVHCYQEPAITGQANPSANTAGGAGSGNIKFMSGDECMHGLWLDNLNPGVGKLFQVGIWNHNSISAQYYPYCVPGGRALLSTVLNFCTVEVAMLAAYKNDTSTITFGGNTNVLQIASFQINGGNFAGLTPAYPIIDIGDNAGVARPNMCVVGMASILNSTGPLFGSSTASVQATATAPTPGNGIFECLSVSTQGAAPQRQVANWNTPVLSVSNSTTATSATAVATIAAGAGSQLRFVPNLPAGAYSNITQAADFGLIYDVGGTGSTGGLLIGHSNYPLRLSNTGAHQLVGSTIILNAPQVEIPIGCYSTYYLAGITAAGTTLATATQMVQAYNIVTGGSGGVILPLLTVASPYCTEVTVINELTSALTVYVPSGYVGFGSVTSFTVPASTSSSFLLYSNTTYAQITSASTTTTTTTTSSGTGAETVYQYNGTFTGAINSSTGSTVAASSMPLYTPLWLTNSSANTITATGVGPQFYTDGTDLRWLSNGQEIS